MKDSEFQMVKQVPPSFKDDMRSSSSSKLFVPTQNIGLFLPQDGKEFPNQYVKPQTLPNFYPQPQNSVMKPYTHNGKFSNSFNSVISQQSDSRTGNQKLQNPETPPTPPVKGNILV